jgi:hypothetical protein
MEIIAEFYSVKINRWSADNIGLVFFDNGVYYVQERVIRRIDLDSHLQLGFGREEVLKGHIRMAKSMMINEKVDLKTYVDEEQVVDVIAKLRRFKVKMVLE